MKYRRLGASGLRVSVVGLGCNAFGSRCEQSVAHRIMSAAADRGITLFDTADTYSGSRSEQIVGRWLSSYGRDRVVLSTKGGGRTGDGPNDSGASRGHLMKALEASLKRLNCDYVDIYNLHYPDVNTPRDETLMALDEMVRTGKIRYIGLSNHAAWQVALSLGVVERRNLVGVAAVQTSYSLVDRTAERDIAPLCLDQGLGLVAYWPLGGGLLTGKYRVGETPPSDSRVLTQPIFEQSFTPERLKFAGEFSAMAHLRGLAPSALALSWVLSRPAVSTVLVGATKEHQLIENLAAVDADLDPHILEDLDRRTLANISTEFRPGGVRP